MTPKLHQPYKLFILLLITIALLQQGNAGVREEEVLKRAFLLTSAHILFAGFDVLLYPAASEQNTVISYRILQFAIQGALTYALVETCNWQTGLAFNVQWWTWNDDLLYYYFYDTINQSDAFRNEVMANRVTWAGWTPVGIVSHGARREPIEGKVLLTQAGIGLAIGFSLTIF